jgi:uncharacterized protein YecE (DUF72 family)
VKGKLAIETLMLLLQRPDDHAKISQAEGQPMKARALIGTSGWNYTDWSDGIFYPEGLKTDEWLAYYAKSFDTVEINNTFYRLPAKQVFEKWHRKTPEHFVFAVKASRFITHMKKLAQPEEHLPLLLENVRGLGKKLGILLFQLPPFWKFNEERLEGFCRFLGHQKQVPGLRCALEIRHPSWYCEACFQILREHNFALVFADWPGFNVQEPLTADFVFIRRHGPESLYASNYPDAYLRKMAGEVRLWLGEGKDVYTYFNNDAYGYAVKNGLRLKEYLKTRIEERGSRIEDKNKGRG